MDGIASRLGIEITNYSGDSLETIRRVRKSKKLQLQKSTIFANKRREYARWVASRRT